MRKSTIIVACLLSFISCSHHDLAPTPDNKPNLRSLSAAEQTVSSANNDFAFDLFKTIQNESGNSNIFISPLSVTMAMAMTMNGACDSTRQSILNMLKFGNYTQEQVDQACKDLISLLTSMDRTVNLGLANSVWSNQRYTVRDSFATTIKNYFDGNVQSLDFSDPNSVNIINSWVASKTNNLIQNLLNNISPDDVMFLVNAIYFKGNWTYQFDPSKTYSAPFYQEDGSSQNVTTMFSKGTKISLLQNQDFLLADIPYGNQQFSMTVLMPTSNYTIDKLTNRLTADSINLWLAKSDMLIPQLELPKFKMSWKKDLKQDLVSLKMDTTGFPYLFKENLPLKISRVIHQSFIDVNEEGTEAAAATATEISLYTLSPAPPLNIKINRSFIYLIREKHSNAILFIGQMILPSDQAN